MTRSNIWILNEISISHISTFEAILECEETLANGVAVAHLMITMMTMIMMMMAIITIMIMMMKLL